MAAVFLICLLGPTTTSFRRVVSCSDRMLANIYIRFPSEHYHHHHQKQEKRESLLGDDFISQSRHMEKLHQSSAKAP